MSTRQIIYVIFLLVLTLTSICYAVPSEVKKVLESRMTFITIDIPQDNDPKAPEKQKEIVKQSWQRASNSGYVREGRMMMPPLWDDIFGKSKLLQFLASKGYVRVEILDMRNYCVQHYEDSCLYKFFYYTDKIAPYARGAYKFGMTGSSPVLVLGKKKLKSIDYSNKIKTEIYRMGKVDVWALTYSYTLDTIFPEAELSRSGTNFKGKLQTLKDPTDGEWKIVKSEKSDSGSREFTFK